MITSARFWSGGDSPHAVGRNETENGQRLRYWNSLAMMSGLGGLPERIARSGTHYSRQYNGKYGLISRPLRTVYILIFPSPTTMSGPTEEVEKALLRQLRKPIDPVLIPDKLDVEVEDGLAGSVVFRGLRFVSTMIEVIDHSRNCTPIVLLQLDRVVLRFLCMHQLVYLHSAALSTTLNPLVHALLKYSELALMTSL